MVWIYRTKRFLASLKIWRMTLRGFSESTTTKRKSANVARSSWRFSVQSNKPSSFFSPLSGHSGVEQVERRKHRGPEEIQLGDLWTPHNLDAMQPAHNTSTHSALKPYHATHWNKHAAKPLWHKVKIWCQCTSIFIMYITLPVKVQASNHPNPSYWYYMS